MVQHFLLSAPARTPSLASIYKAGEAAACGTFYKMRWAETEGAPVCPRCGGLRHYDVKGRRKFKCAACAHQFSVTSGTIFASRKMAFVDLCAAVCTRAARPVGTDAAAAAADRSVAGSTRPARHHRLQASQPCGGI